MTLTPGECLEDLAPGLGMIVEAVKAAPLSAEGRADLAFLIAGYFFSLAAATQRESGTGMTLEDLAPTLIQQTRESMDSRSH